MDYSQELARFAAELKAEDIPASVLRRTEDLFLDWAASKGMKALMEAINIAYDEDETRGFVKLRLLAYGFTVGGVLLVVTTVFAVTALPKGPKFFRILFLDEDNSLFSQMAVAIARNSYPKSGRYGCAGRVPAATLNPIIRVL